MTYVYTLFVIYFVCLYYYMYSVLCVDILTVCVFMLNKANVAHISVSVFNNAMWECSSDYPEVKSLDRQVIVSPVTTAMIVITDHSIFQRMDDPI